MNHFSAFSIHVNVTFSDCPQFVVDGWGRRRFRAPVARLQGKIYGPINYVRSRIGYFCHLVVAVDRKFPIPPSGNQTPVGKARRRLVPMASLPLLVPLGQCRTVHSKGHDPLSVPFTLSVLLLFGRSQVYILA